jgi:hypothetical protein
MLDTISPMLQILWTKYRAKLIYCSVMLLALGLMARSYVAQHDQSNWTETTGSIGMFGRSSSKSGDSVQVSYKNVTTGQNVTGKMRLLSSSEVQAALERGGIGSKDEPMLYVDTLLGDPAVCSKHNWDSCVAATAFRPWMFLAVIGLFAIGAIPMIKDARKDLQDTKKIHT